MPHNHADTIRHGGPGSSHQDATEPFTPSHATEAGQSKTSSHQRHPDHSGISGGGGERDSHHTHNPATKS